MSTAAHELTTTTNHLAAHAGRILFLGCGSVTQCTLPLVLREIGVAPDRVTVLDMVDNRHRIASELALGVRYVIDEITPDTMADVLGAHLGSGDICLDLAWNIETTVILQWCRDNGVRYLNTSVELWDPYADGRSTHPLQRTLYVRHMAMRRMIASWSDNRGPSAVVEHGANPGLVSHWTKQALLEIGEQALRDRRIDDASAVEAALAAEQWNELARALGVKVVHISERDSQITDRPKQVDEIVNTWSIDGLYEEGIAPAEIGWGTHERSLPPLAHRHVGEGPCNQIALARMGCETWVRSCVPSGPILGMIIRHGEAFTINDHLTVWQDGEAVYRPTVHYAYCPCDAALASMHELAMRGYVMQRGKRIMNDEIISGRDELGVLLLGHPYGAWWTGSVLSIDEARALVPGQSATTLQVAASVLGAVVWMIEHPREGVRVPDELPWREVLAVAMPYLGTLHSGRLEWDPSSGRHDLFAGWDDAVTDEDPLQFTNLSH